MDSNVLLIASDFEKFQKIIAKMHKEVSQLMDINKDVLLGKKNTNCLSCNNGKEAGMEKYQSTMGKDGKIYYGVLDRLNNSSMNHHNTNDKESSEITKVFVDFKLNSGRMKSSKAAYKETRNEDRAMWDFMDDKSATMQGGKTNNNSNSSLN